MRAFMLSWYGLVDLDYAGIPLGIFGGEQEAVRAAHNIGPGEYHNGTITLYWTTFPGLFRDTIPIMRWDYRTCYSGTGDYAELSNFRIL